jgi:hypothetical protein
MKKALLTLTAVTATVLTTFAQGHVSFNNQSSLDVTNATVNPSDAITISAYHQPGGGNTGDGIGGDKYAVQLVWVAGTVLSQDAFDAGPQTFGPVVYGTGSQGAANNAFLSNTGPLSTFSGFFDAGVIPNPAGTSMPPGGYTMQVLAWYKVGFADYYSAVAAGVNTGRSALFNMTVSAGVANPTVFPGFEVGFIPEPSTLALLGLGAMAMLVFRRKN